MLEHVLPPNVDDEREFWLKCRDVSKVLFGTDSDVDATRPHRLQNYWYRLLISRFIGNEVIRPKLAIRFGELGNHVPELSVRQTVGQRVRLSRRRITVDLAWSLRWRSATGEKKG